VHELFNSLTEPFLLSLFIYNYQELKIRLIRKGIMTTLRVNLAEIGSNGKSDAAIHGTKSQAGLSVFLCDSKGNVSSYEGKGCEPLLVDEQYLEIEDAPPGKCLLFVRS
jgi:hypothetical protein